ncbi:hypothetical protein DV451_001657 [Geotrichum candidum]|uniref:Uncharacterized protein n=1 Tax=Geotrichum candidum TaxID=1173061 RepID=A0A9P5G7D6_GEOCN|nr:hypothetical protein DV451_001657 [Geotrichum candidum]
MASPELTPSDKPPSPDTVSAEEDKAAKVAAAKKRQKKKNKKSKKSGSNEEKTTANEGVDEDKEKSAKDTPSTAETPHSDNPDDSKKEKADEPDSALDDNNETVTSEKVEPANNKEILDLQSQLDSANENIDSLKTKLEEALAQVAELTKTNQALEKTLEEEKAKKPVVEEYEEGPGPQVGGEASSESINVTSLEAESLKHKIESLTVENEYLSDKVFSLENKLSTLVTKQRASLEFARDSPDHFSKEPLSPNSDHSKPQRESPEIQSEIEKLMDRWKGWQVDMRGWRSLGIGPTFDI